MPIASGSIQQLPAVSTPSGNPASGNYLLYFKNDGVLYRKDSGGTEAAVSSGAASSTMQVGVARVASPSNITLSGTQTIDGIAVVAGDFVLAPTQTSTTERGLWVVASGAWTRHPDFDTAAKLAGAIVRVQSGTLYGGTIWHSVQKSTAAIGNAWNQIPDSSTAVTLDTTQTFTASKQWTIAGSGGNAIYLYPQTGSATSGTPNIDSPRLYLRSHYWNGTSEQVDDAQLNIVRNTATALDSWLYLSGTSGFSAPTYRARLAGTTSARFVGGSTGAAPTSGTFLAGDYVITNSGRVWICTTGGTPGTWSLANAGDFVDLSTSQTITGSKTWSMGSSANAILLYPPSATSGTTQTNSPKLYFRTGYWDGAAAQVDDAMLGLVRNSVTPGDTYLSQTGSGVLGFSAFRVRATATGTNARFVGGTGTSAPASGTYLVGDFAVGSDGTIWICTVAGTPGTWVAAGTGQFVDLSSSQTINALKTFTRAVYGFGDTGAAIQFESSLAADASNTLVDSPALRFRSRYWSGSASTNLDANLWVDQIAADGTASGHRLTTDTGFSALSGLYDGSNRVYSASNPPPASTLTVASPTTTHTAVAGSVVLANGTFTVTLPTVAAGAQVTVKNIGTGTITVSRAGATALIDGAATAVISTQYASITVVSDGTNWFII